jgi:hypothetical protein
MSFILAHFSVPTPSLHLVFCAAGYVDMLGHCSKSIDPCKNVGSLQTILGGIQAEKIRYERWRSSADN